MWFFVSCIFIFILWIFICWNDGIKCANIQIFYFIVGYILEIFLSIDNVLLWFLVFETFKMPSLHQRTILLYGVWGAIILRFIFIFSGLFVLSKWHWLLYFFGFIFIFSGFKILFSNNEKIKEQKICIPWFYKIFRVTKEVDNKKFFVIKNRKFFITPFFLCLGLIEFSDIFFAMDSIPAIFSITDNFFILFTSNIFAVLGLRSIYFLLIQFIRKISFIKYILSLVLIFLGLKIFMNSF